MFSPRGDLLSFSPLDGDTMIDGGIMQQGRCFQGLLGRRSAVDAMECADNQHAATDSDNSETAVITSFLKESC